MSEITTVGLDLAKRVVSLCGEDACGRWSCSARYAGRRFGRELAALCHTPRIIARLAAWLVATYERIGYHKTLVAID